MKKILALFLSLLMLLSTVSVTVFANPVGFQEKNVYETNDYVTDDQLAILAKLGITSWSSISSLGYRHEEVVSRWFVAFWLYNMGVSENVPANGFETMFKDLTSEHKWYSRIKGAVQAGLMQGYPDGYFRPNEPVSTDEATEVMLKVLGYQPYIKIFGKAQALKQTKIMEGIPAGESMTQDMMMRMIYNTLNSPAISTNAWTAYANGDVDITYVIDESYLGFEHLYGVKHEMAVLDGIQGSTLVESGDIIKDGYVTIAGVDYEYADDATDLLGYRVNYLYKEQNGIRKIVHLFKSEKNEELVLEHDMIESFENGVYTYYNENDKEKTVVISPETHVIYNDVANPAYTQEEMIPSFGKVTFIDNNGKKGYEVVKIDDYDFYFSSAINATTNKIIDSEGDVVKTLDLSEPDYLEIWNGNSQIAFGRIKKSNLLVVKRSSANSDFDRVKVECFKVSNKSVKVSAVREDYIETSSGRFDVWSGVVDAFEMGKYYNLYKYNDVVVLAIEDAESGYEYAYLINMGVDGDAFNKFTRFAVVDMDGNFNEYEGAEKINVDGTVVDNVDTMWNNLNRSALMTNGYSEDYPLSQPVRLDYNSIGQINKIDTYYHDAEKEDENAIRIIENAAGSPQYNSYAHGLYSLIEGSTTVYQNLVASIETSTNILFIPGDRFEEDSYMSRALTNGEKYKLDIAGIADNIYIADNVFVYYNPQNDGIGGWTRQFIISDLEKGINDDGEIVCTVSGYYINQTKEYTCEEELFNQFEIGDIYKFEVDKNNRIIASEKVLGIDEVPDRQNRQMITGTNGAISSANGTIYGSLVHFQGSFVRVSQALPTDIEDYDPDFKADNYYIGTTGIYKYSVVQGQPSVTASSLAEATPYTTDPENPSTVVINVLNGTNQIYIIEK